MQGYIEFKETQVRAEAITHYVVRTGLELIILLFQPAEGWGPQGSCTGAHYRTYATLLVSVVVTPQTLP